MVEVKENLEINTPTTITLHSFLFFSFLKFVFWLVLEQTHKEDVVAPEFALHCDSGTSLRPGGIFFFVHVHQICLSHLGNRKINDSCSPCLLYEDLVASQVTTKQEKVSSVLLIAK